MNVLRVERPTLIVAAGGALLSSLTLPAYAAGEPTSSGGIGAGLEEVVVSARRREESMQETPISVAVLSEEALKVRDAVNLRDLSRIVPSFGWQPATGGGNSAGQLFVRGIGQFDFVNTTDPSVGLYVDGVIFARTTGASLDLLDIERIEVLRGPQGTLFGRNTAAGAVNIITKKPMNEFGGVLEAAAGSRDRMDLSLSSSLPILPERLLAHVTLSSKNQDGYGRRLSTGEETADVNNDVGRAHLQWLASDDVSVLLSADYARRKGRSGAETLVDFDENDFLVSAYNALHLNPQGLSMDDRFITRDKHDSYAGERNRDDYELWGASLTVDWSAEAAQIKSITAFRELDVSFGLDFDGTPFPFSEEEVDDSQRQFSQELQLHGAAFSGRLDWLLGAYYFEEHSNSRIFVSFMEGLVGAVPVGSPFDFLAGLDFSSDLRNVMDNRAFAGFAHGAFSITDRLDLSAGLRYTSERKELFVTNTAPFSGFSVVPGVRVKDEWSDLSPAASLDYKIADGKMVYLSAAKGFRSGGFNGRPFSSAAQVTSFEPEELLAYEVGFKSEWMNRTLRLNASAFLYDYSDFQITVIAGTEVAPIITVGNAASVEAYGAEAELVFEPIDSLVLAVSAAYLENEFVKVGAQADTITENTKLINAPRWTISPSISYAWRFGGGEMSMQADAYYKGGHHFLFANSPTEYQSSYTLLNARAAYTTGDGRWELAVYGKNLTDELYKVLAVDSGSFGGMTVATFGRPREWGAVITHRF
jgi:iron complex outermembrane recepter protein